MPAICDLEGCWEVGDFFLKGYALCPEHGDAVIDKLRESGVSVHEATVAHILDVLSTLVLPEP